MDLSEIQSTLENCELFKDLKKADIEKIVHLSRIEEYAPGEYVFSQGDFGEHLYIIAQGTIFLEHAVDLGRRKGNVIIGTLGTGRVFGCWSTLLGEAHNLLSSATCQKSTRVILIRGSDLRKVMNDNAQIGFSVLQRLCLLLRDRLYGVFGALEKV